MQQILPQLNSKIKCLTSYKGKTAKSSMARSLSVENLLPQSVGWIINYL